MQMSALWDENNLPREELEEWEIDLEMRAALASMPDRPGTTTFAPLPPQPPRLAPARAGAALGFQRSAVARTSEAASSP
jgi:hypothetical protein